MRTATTAAANACSPSLTTRIQILLLFQWPTSGTSCPTAASTAAGDSRGEEGKNDSKGRLLMKEKMLKKIDHCQPEPPKPTWCSPRQPEEEKCIIM
ncbi:hypothetical protein INT44_001229 [Umbelopsis vinacea]|uniref:Secreted protein n=1 Tax=Umbelopsis vinacea TaxID=44442 RepID=A0A8H7QBT4_9FUNG|nr:hypothetical protein INT44_001229 [Umbelopsis vinacea]